MELFAVFKMGVYQQGIGGIFQSKERAIEVTCQLASEDMDEYHTWTVVEFELDAITPQIRNPSFHSFDHKPIYSTRKGAT